MTRISVEAMPQELGIQRRDVLLAGTLVAGSGAALLLRPRSDPSAAWGSLETAVPDAIGSYRVSDAGALAIPVTDPMLERTYTDLLTRIYVAPGLAPIMLLIALGDGGGTGLAVHRPEECYIATGFDLSAAASLPVVGLPRAGSSATIVTAHRGTRIEQIYFWVRIGERFPASARDQRWTTAAYDLSGRRAAGALVRLSVVSDSREAAMRQLGVFNGLLLAALPPAGRRLIVGAA